MKLLFSISLIVFNIYSFGQTTEAIMNSTKLSGYFENKFSPQEIAGTLTFQDYNKLRLNIASEISKDIKFNANINCQTYHGKTNFNMFDFMPDNIVHEYSEQIGLPIDSLSTMYTFSLNNDIFLDNAYLSIYKKNFNIRIGKQQLPWGTGYAWNPTDFFNVKNVLDPTYEKTGVNAFKAEVPLGDKGMVTGIVSVGEDWPTSVKAIKAKYYIGGFDLSASYAEKTQVNIDYNSFSKESEKKQMIGGDISGSILGVGIWAEAAFNKLESPNDYWQLVAGTDYTLNNGLYLMLEYFHNENGKNNFNEYTFDDWMLMLGPSAEGLGKDYVYAGQMFPICELINWSNYCMVNINDGSGMIMPWFDISINDNTDFAIAGYFPFGRKGTEYGEFGKGGFARIRIYF